MASNLEKLITALAVPIQAVENALQQLLTERTVDTAIGAQLDVIGKIVNQKRGGLIDDDYRQRIRARIAVHRSHGTTNDLIRIALLVINDATSWIEVDNQGAAGTVVRWRGVIADTATADVLITFLKEAASAGIRVILETLTALEDDSFTTALTQKIVVGIGSGETKVYYDAAYDPRDMRDWPNSGTLVVDDGDPLNEETLTYTALVRPNQQAVPYFVITPAVKPHVNGGLLILQDVPGKGFGTTADPDVGGKLAKAQD